MQIAPDMGVILNGLDLHNRAAGLGFKTNDIDNWWGPTASTGRMSQHPGGSGGLLNEARSAGRHLVLSGSVRGRNFQETAAMLRALTAAIPLDEPAPLVVYEDGQPWHALVRQEDKPDYSWKSDTHATFDVQLHAAEWRILSGDGAGASYSVTVGLPRTEGGRRRPFRLPSAINATVVSGSVVVANSGSAPAPVMILFEAVDRPSVRLPDGQQMTFDLAVLPGQVLGVNLTDLTVLLNGVSRRGAMQGGWLRLAPGDNILSFDAASYSESARMTVLWSESRK